MPLDIERNSGKANIRVMFSRTVELVCALSCLAAGQNPDFSYREVYILYNSLTEKSRDTISVISSMRLKGLELHEFVLKEKIFDDVELLIKRIRTYDQTDFIYTFAGEELPPESIQGLCRSSEDLDKLIKEQGNNISESRENLKYLFCRTEEFKNAVVELLRELNNKHFDNIVKSQAAYYGMLADEVKHKLEGKQPLDFSQELYEKKFRRIYDFKDYFFIPSYFLKPNKIRFFNFNTQIIIFSMDYDRMKRLEAGNRISSILKVISDRTRLEILRELSAGPCYGKTLAEKLGLTTSTISHHLDQLNEMGLVSEERIKNTKYFRVNQREIDKVISEFREYLAVK